ncbi:unnamed protein product [Caenorhabditis auriculariae]|uniref:BHLH domain-containing protein n=1 Tax=Caenorhabditis auriculariae TaxID=2777116 RepID=A0A8S1H570_9PELO|nr:unnamed protein product [Caenorhabditis auriculariae]
MSEELENQRLEFDHKTVPKQEPEELEDVEELVEREDELMEAASSSNGSVHPPSEEEIHLRLIDCVRSEPALFDPSDENFGTKRSSQAFRNQTWNHFTDELNWNSPVSMQSIWKSLKERYIRKRKGGQVEAEDREILTPKVLEAMRFFDPFFGLSSNSNPNPACILTREKDVWESPHSQTIPHDVMISGYKPQTPTARTRMMENEPVTTNSTGTLRALKENGMMVKEKNPEQNNEHEEKDEHDVTLDADLLRKQQQFISTSWKSRVMLLIKQGKVQREVSASFPSLDEIILKNSKHTGYLQCRRCRILFSVSAGGHIQRHVSTNCPYTAEKLQEAIENDPETGYVVVQPSTGHVNRTARPVKAHPAAANEDPTPAQNSNSLPPARPYNQTPTRRFIVHTGPKHSNGSAAPGQFIDNSTVSVTASGNSGMVGHIKKDPRTMTMLVDTSTCYQNGSGQKMFRLFTVPSSAMQQPHQAPSTGAAVPTSVAETPVSMTEYEGHHRMIDPMIDSRSAPPPRKKIAMSMPQRHGSPSTSHHVMTSVASHHPSNYAQHPNAHHISSNTNAVLASTLRHSLDGLLTSGTEDEIIEDGIQEDTLVIDPTEEESPLLSESPELSSCMISGQQTIQPRTSIHHHHHHSMVSARRSSPDEEPAMINSPSQYDSDLQFQQLISSHLSRMNDDDKAIMKYNIQRIMLDVRFGSGTSNRIVHEEEVEISDVVSHEMETTLDPKELRKRRKINEKALVWAAARHINYRLRGCAVISREAAAGKGITYRPVFVQQSKDSATLLAVICICIVPHGFGSNKEAAKMFPTETDYGWIIRSQRDGAKEPRRKPLRGAFHGGLMKIAALMDHWDGQGGAASSVLSVMRFTLDQSAIMLIQLRFAPFRDQLRHMLRASAVITSRNNFASPLIQLFVQLLEELCEWRRTSSSSSGRLSKQSHAVGWEEPAAPPLSVRSRPPGSIIRAELSANRRKLFEMAPSTSSSSSSPEVGDQIKRKQRRIKANGRERARMHGLNDALDVLRQYVPLTTQHQKLSKIETLRLARNYIGALQQMLQSGRQPTPLEYAHQLSFGLSQTTTNMLANLLQVQPRMLLPPSGLPVYEQPSFSPCSSAYSPVAPSAVQPPITGSPPYFYAADAAPPQPNFGYPQGSESHYHCSPTNNNYPYSL